jgi:type I restriction enzyme R subunit
MSSAHKEVSFEAAIELHLLANGWSKVAPGGYRVDLGFDPDELIAFVRATQPKEWERLVGAHGNEAKAVTKFCDRVRLELDSRGVVDCLRRPVADHGVKVRLAYFQPAHTLTEHPSALYAGNRLGIARQLHHSESKPNDSLDMVLLVNGIPTATAELKNPLTAQDVTHAKEQYRKDRNPADLIFTKRAIAHFAVDPDEVYVTTRLTGPTTRFLPFNQGSAGSGVAGGAGNPSNLDGYSTSYLWERVWDRGAWLDLLARFVHVTKPTAATKGKAAEPSHVIFPRYHQWHAVRSLLAHAASHGPGTNYLAMHSAGSGKSNSIAWLAHRLSSLHTLSDAATLQDSAAELGPNVPVFSKVIVITDRVVLDKQLQDTIFQFDHVEGLVQRIDKDSAQLAEALSGQTARIIITTLQKFPFVLDQLDELAGNRFAVIVDEAHSSQTGETAKALKAVLAKGSEAAPDDDAALDAAAAADAAEEAAVGDGEDKLVESVRARGRQKNISFFAFTATPKQKTLELFGTRVPVGNDEELRPFHTYSMRQAIDEEFILDVLANYVTYSTYFKLATTTPDAADDEVDVRKAGSALARFVSLHPSNLAQKAEIIVEHFRHHTAKKVGGHAKAMVVTRSRLHAIRYKQAIDTYIQSKGYKDCRALVAFSGTVVDPLAPAVSYTEALMNGFGEAALPERFDTDEYQVLVVAEKYQTGFDQPLLHTMYVDKKLEGIKAVQTLSRLNRIHPAKDDTFVLDFANSAEEMQEHFRPFYETVIAEPTDPNVLYNLQTRVEAHPIIVASEVDALVTALLNLPPTENARANQQLYAHTNAARKRWEDYAADDGAIAEEFRDALKSFVRTYAFLAQVVPYHDADLEKLYLFGKVLLPRLPAKKEGALDLGEEVELTHLRTEATGTHDLNLGEGDGDHVLPGITGDGRGPMSAARREALATIVERLNDRFGTTLSEADQLSFDQMVAAATEVDDLAEAARANDQENFGLVFDGSFEGIVIDRHDANTTILKKFLDDNDFAEMLTRWARDEAYRRLREGEGA